jgi:hypothetical protein
MAAAVPAALVVALPAAPALAMAGAAVGASGTTKGCVMAASVQITACVLSVLHFAWSMQAMEHPALPCPTHAPSDEKLDMLFHSSDHKPMEADR